MLPPVPDRTADLRSDAQLRSAYGAGDPLAFDRLYERYKDPLYRYFCRQCAPSDRGPELFLRLWTQLVAATAKHAPALGFKQHLYSQAHAAVLGLRPPTSPRSGGEVGVPPPGGSPLRLAGEPSAEASPEESFASARWALLDWQENRATAGGARTDNGTGNGTGEKGDLLALLAALTDQEREVFLLHEEGGLGLEELAEILGGAPETVLGQLHRAAQGLGISLADLATRNPTAYHRLTPLAPPESLDAQILAAARATLVAHRPPSRAGTPPPSSAPSGKAPPSPGKVRADPPSPPLPRGLLLALAVTSLLGLGWWLNPFAPGPGVSPRPAPPVLGAGLALPRGGVASVLPEASLGESAPNSEAPPPLEEGSGMAQIPDLAAAIGLLRKALLEVNAGSPAAAATPVPASLIQPRERRLAKILELYDRGNPELAVAALEIFLRDFEDDPVSQRILGLTN